MNMNMNQLKDNSSEDEERNQREVVKRKMRMLRGNKKKKSSETSSSDDDDDDDDYSSSSVASSSEDDNVREVENSVAALVADDDIKGDDTGAGAHSGGIAYTRTISQVSSDDKVNDCRGNISTTSSSCSSSSGSGSSYDSDRDSDSSERAKGRYIKRATRAKTRREREEKIRSLVKKTAPPTYSQCVGSKTQTKVVYPLHALDTAISAKHAPLPPSYFSSLAIDGQVLPLPSPAACNTGTTITTTATTTSTSTTAVNSNGKNRTRQPDSQSNTKSLADHFKTRPCRNWEQLGMCTFGSRCRFAHGAEELRPLAEDGTEGSQLASTTIATTDNVFISRRPSPPAALAPATVLSQLLHTTRQFGPLAPPRMMNPPASLQASTIGLTISNGARFTEPTNTRHKNRTVAEEAAASIKFNEMPLDRGNSNLLSSSLLSSLKRDTLEGSHVAIYFRTELCVDYSVRGTCPRGAHCFYAHGNENRRTVQQNTSEGITTIDAVETFKDDEIARMHERMMPPPPSSAYCDPTLPDPPSRI